MSERREPRHAAAARTTPAPRGRAAKARETMDREPGTVREPFTCCDGAHVVRFDGPRNPFTGGQTILITIDGVTEALEDLTNQDELQYPLSRRLVARRLRSGWCPARALSEPNRLKERERSRPGWSPRTVGDIFTYVARLKTESQILADPIAIRLELNLWEYKRTIRILDHGGRALPENPRALPLHRWYTGLREAGFKSVDKSVNIIVQIEDMASFDYIEGLIRLKETADLSKRQPLSGREPSASASGRRAPPPTYNRNREH